MAFRILRDVPVDPKLMKAYRNQPLKVGLLDLALHRCHGDLRYLVDIARIKPAFEQSSSKRG